VSSRSLPSRIGRYEVVDRLGAGGMGVLYLARDPLLRRTLAIKVLAVDDDDLRERFAREARSAAALSHTNIVTIFDVGEDAGYPFLAMEYLDGETMAEMIRRKAPVALQRRLQMLLELCAGLGYAHRLGIIHRDVKPANLMITGNGTLKILDFGLARLTHDNTSGLTQAGALLGTPNYMSPEQVQGGTVDHRSDIFSVGLVLYELLTYRKAFSGEGMHVILHKIVHERPQPLRELDPAIDPALERIVERAIEREPDRRYQSLELLSADATAFLKALAGRPDADATVIIRRGERPELPPRKSDASSGGGRTPATPRVPNFEGIARRREAQIQLHLDEASRHFDEGRYEQAIEQCELAAVLNPEEPRVFDLLSRAHGARDDQQIALWLSEAQARLSEGALTQAEQLVQQSLEQRPAHPEAQALRRQIQDARRAREQAHERERAVASALERARAHAAEGALEAVVRAANEALAFDADHPEAQSLKQQALETLDVRRREAEHEQRAQSAAAAARRAARAGDLDGAAALLAAFAPPHPVVDAARGEVQAQIEARARAAADEAARLREEEERQREEDARRREEEDRQRAEEEQRRAEEAAAARAQAERERQAREQAEREAVERAQRETAERAAREAAERERLERDAAEQAAREAAARDAAAERAARDAAGQERIAKEGAAGALVWSDETRPANDPTNPMTMALEAARQEALQRAASTAAERRAAEAPQPPPSLSRPVSNRPPAAVAPQPSAVTPFPIKWAALVVLVGLTAALVVFLLLRRGSEPAATPVSQASTARPAAETLAEAQRLNAEGNRERALDVAVKGYRDTRDQSLADFVAGLRTAAAKRASDAATEASGDAAKQKEYAEAAAKFQRAAALTSMEDAARAVALYGEAEKGYRAAVTASSNDPAVFVRRATEAYDNGAVDRAIEYALTARRLDPTHAAADKIIERIRRDAGRETARARAAAVTAAATTTDEFGRAEKRAKDASKTTAPEDLLAQVSASQQATQLYRRAVSAAESARAERHAAAERHAQQARALISQKRFDDAEAELTQATSAEPQNTTARTAARELSDARRTAAQDATNARIASLLQQSRGVDARQAVPLLQQAASLDASREDVKRELQRRTDELNARSSPPPVATSPPPPPRPAAPARGAHDADAGAILQVLDRYKKAWEALDVDAIQKVYPGVNAGLLRDSFKQVNSQQMTLQPQAPDIDASGTTAVLRCRVVSRVDVKAGTRREFTSEALFFLSKARGTWVIAGLQYTDRR
jgi:serine/threonine protein kinase